MTNQEIRDLLAEQLLRLRCGLRRGPAPDPAPARRAPEGLAPLDSLSPPAGGAGAVLYAAGLLAEFADWLAGLERKGGKRRDMV